MAKEVVRTIRAPEDIADMLGWIVYFEKRGDKPKADRRTIMQIVDDLMRDEVAEMYAPHMKEATRIAKALGQELKAGQVPRPPTRE